MYMYIINIPIYIHINIPTIYIWRRVKAYCYHGKNHTHTAAILGYHPGTIRVPSGYHPGTIRVPSGYHPGTTLLTHNVEYIYPLINVNKKLLNMAIEIVDFPINSMVIFHSYGDVYQRVYIYNYIYYITYYIHTELLKMEGTPNHPSQ